jgi:hypothetical protein
VSRAHEEELVKSIENKCAVEVGAANMLRSCAVEVAQMRPNGFGCWDSPLFFQAISPMAGLGLDYLAKKMQSPQPRPSQPPSNSALDTEKWAPESAIMPIEVRFWCF